MPQADSTKEQESGAGFANGNLGTLAAGPRSEKIQTLARWYLIEFHRRFALPTSCLVLALVGIPLGLSSKKGGKSTGFVLAILLVFAYYSASLVGVSLARQGKLSPAFGVWLADIVFFLGGAFLLWRAEHRPFEITSLRRLLASVRRGNARSLLGCHSAARKMFSSAPPLAAACSAPASP